MQVNKTCVSCKSKHLSSFIEVCVNCLRNDKPDNRFPNWEKEYEKTS